MTALRKRASLVRLFAFVAVLALVAAACSTDTTTTTVPGDGPTTTAPPATDPGDDTPPPTEPPTGGQLDTYTLGIFQDVTTDNLWNSYDTQGNTVWNSYFLGSTTASPYGIQMPGIELQPALAEGDLQPAVQEGDVWVGTITLREGLQWSDGEPLTANDYVFTWNTAVEFGLTANWANFTRSSIVDSVEAADDRTIRVIFNDQPGLAVWGPGTGPHMMPIMPEHFWADVVEEARNSEDPRLTLLAASGAEAPASGSTIFSDRQEGSFAAAVANPNYYDSGAQVTSGGVSWTEGPFAQSFQFPLYGGQEAAVLALANGEVDLLLNPLGMQRGFQEQVINNPDLTAIVNPTNGYRFMAFNHERFPMSDAAFRDALTALIDKEFVTENLLQGVAFPLYVILPEGNTAWYNEEVAAELAEIGYAGWSTDDRRAEAIRLLTEAGYTWDSAPGWYNSDGDYSATAAEGFTWRIGDGLRGPDGNAVPQLDLVTPTAGYDPLRATFGNYISGVALELGIPLVAVPTDFNKIVADVFNYDDDAARYVSDFDMFILGYSLGNAAFPTFHGAFFHTTGDSNNTQYSSADYDSWSEAFDAAQTIEEAYAAMWEMERLIAIDKPHVPLFDTGILEFYNNRVDYPFTETLSGLQFVGGAQSAVFAR